MSLLQLFTEYGRLALDEIFQKPFQVRKPSICIPGVLLSCFSFVTVMYIKWIYLNTLFVAHQIPFR